MNDRGFIPEFPHQVFEEIYHLKQPASPHGSNVKDLRHLLWCSIDNDNSRDLDQLTYAEKKKIYIAVADVDALVKHGTQTDRYAAHNTTSVYTPSKVFPMLPEKLSTDLTSLNEKSDRCANVVEVTVESNGDFSLSDIYPALVRNQAKLAYNSVAAWIEREVPLPVFEKLPELANQLLLQDRIAQSIKDFRNLKGALYFATVELLPVVADGLVVELRESKENRAHQLIENFMIAANVAVTQYLKKHQLPILRRVVKTPSRWDRIVSLAKSLGGSLPFHPDAKALQEFLIEQQKANPEKFADLSLSIIKLIGKGEYTLDPKQGHFDLALRDYAHTTAPNRRYPDVIMQRILKSALYSDYPIPYGKAELTYLAKHCTQKEDDATKVERRMVKCAAAFLLQDRIGEKFSALITGASPKGTWVRLKTPPVEGKLTRGCEGFDVGDTLEVKLLRVDILNGHIDFKKC
ncbi:MAG: RNB domain-containing ribonuclease [Verrucomicrobia bacterium]|nr:RNB domain-containing ribonuclease [Verrucomicrobiota bacterium]